MKPTAEVVDEIVALQDYDDIDRDGVVAIVEQERAAARAAGYAEAIEKAAVLCDSWHVTCCVDVAMTDLGNEVRALAPAATPEKP